MSSPVLLRENLLRTTGLAAVILAIAGAGAEAAERGFLNPIGKVARVFNPTLVKVEERVDFLNRQLHSLAVHEEHALKVGIGCRGAKHGPGAPDPELVIDLGKETLVDEIYLVPLQGELSEGNSIFPKKFTIEFSTVEDFSIKRVLYRSGGNYFPETGGMPVRFAGQGAKARYVKLIVNQGSLRGQSEIYGISEFVVISGGYPVSFGCDVAAVGSLNVENLWFPEAVTDGRMPLGVWQGGNWANRRDSDIERVEADERIDWTMQFGREVPMDLLIVYPVDAKDLLEAGILPESIIVEAGDMQGNYREVLRWENPIPGVNRVAPLVLDLEGVRGTGLRLIGASSRDVGGEWLTGMSEIEVWSDRKNVSKGMDVVKHRSGTKSGTGFLTDGYAGEREIIPVGSWLNQLHNRWRVESEIKALRPMHAQMAAESELNATWGSAMMLGLTFLIPVFIVERRRLISRNQVEQLRKRIASDLHDDIGSNLGSISLIARTARKDLLRLQGPMEVGEDLDEVESIARESSLAMRDIVWLLERKQDSIGDLVQRMRETAGRLLREIDYTVDCESSKGSAKLSLDAKRHLFLFYKEAVHNIIKHSKATVVTIRLWDDGDKLVLEVTDNGMGLPLVTEAGIAQVLPVRKLDERARVLEGVLGLFSEPGKGTRILLTVKRSLLMATPAI